MQHKTHSAVSIIRAHVDAWRKHHGWSRETAAMEIVGAHERLGNDVASGIIFNPPTQDSFERARVNADRVFRWLDDATKDTNLLPLNFLRSILVALPVDRRVRLLNELLGDLGLYVFEETGPIDALDAVKLLQAVIKETGEANTALAALVDGATEDELLVARSELIEGIGSLQKALDAVNAELKVCV